MAESGPPTPAIPAGWYSDPAGSSGTRWWDGAGWTDHVQAAPQLVPTVVPAPSTPAPITPTVLTPTALTSTPILPTAAEQAYVPFQSATSVVPPRVTGVAYTRSVWWICAQPLWGIASQVVLYSTITAFGPVPVRFLALGLVVLNLVLWGILVRLAFADRAGLLAGGNGSAASAWWMLLSPLAYLVARAQHVKLWEVGAWAPVVWWSLALIIAPGLAVAGVFAVYGIVAP
ncbi:MAG: hypothetical protein QOK08_5 [Actinomycetota bacterium]|nr:hypothetical protein [Actinomycetota bacterium]